jgi:hypothetical protein
MQIIELGDRTFRVGDRLRSKNGRRPDIGKIAAIDETEYGPRFTLVDVAGNIFRWQWHYFRGWAGENVDTMIWRNPAPDGAAQGPAPGTMREFTVGPDGVQARQPWAGKLDLPDDR